MHNHNTDINYINFKLLILDEITNFKSKFSKAPLAADAKAYIDAIGALLNKATTGGDLHDALAQEIDKMPGWWSFMSDARSFTLALKKSLTQFPHKQLLQADLDKLKNNNNLLTEKYTQLELRYFTLKKNLEFLGKSDLVETNLNLIIINDTLKERVFALEKVNGNQEQIIANLQEEIKKITVTNKQLEESSTQLAGMYNKLLAQHESFKTNISSQIKLLQAGQQTQEIKINKLIKEKTGQEMEIKQLQAKLAERKTRSFNYGQNRATHFRTTSPPITPSHP